MPSKGLSIPIRLQNELSAGLDVAAVDLRKFVDGAVTANAKLADSYKLASKQAGEAASVAVKGSKEQSAALKLQADYAKKAAAATGESAAASTRSFGLVGKSADDAKGKIGGLLASVKSLALTSAGLGAAFGGYELFKGAIDQAETYQKAQRSLSVEIKKLGGNFKQVQPDINRWAQSQAQFGVSVTDAEAGFSRLIPIVGGAQRALEAYHLALVLSKGGDIDLTAAERAVAKAFDGKTTSLTRYGVILQKNASIQQITNLIEQRYGGLAKTNTEATDKLKASVANIELEIGKELLPTINKWLDALTKWLSKSGNQKKITDDVKTAVHDFGAVIRAVTPDVKGIDKVTGGFSNTLEILGTVLVGLKFKALIGSITGIGAAATVSKGEVAGLRGGLLALGDSAVLGKLGGLAGGLAAVFALGGAGRETQSGGPPGALAYKGQWIDPKTGHFVAMFNGKEYQLAKASASQIAAAKAGAHHGGNIPPGGTESPQRQSHKAAGGSGFGGQTKTKTAPDGTPINWEQFVGQHAGEDCSLFTQRAYKKLWNISIPRRSEEQFHGGHAASGGEVGDLLFYNGHNIYAPPGHVALYIGNGQLIQDNGSGTVQIMAVSALNSLGYMGSRTYLAAGKAGQAGLPAAPGSASAGGSGSTPSERARAAVTGILGMSAAPSRAATVALAKAESAMSAGNYKKAITDFSAYKQDEEKILKAEEHERSKLRKDVASSSGKAKAAYEAALKKVNDNIAKTNAAIIKAGSDMSKATADQAKKLKAAAAKNAADLKDATGTLLQQIETAGDAVFEAQIAPLQAQLDALQQAITTQNDAQNVSDAQTALNQALMLGDPAAIKQASQALNDALNQQSVDSLQSKINKIQGNEDAFNQSIESLIATVQGGPNSLSALLAQLASTVGAGSTAFAQAISILGQYGISVPPGTPGTGGGPGGGNGGTPITAPPGAHRPGPAPPWMASGGIVRHRTLAWIGEKGPEAVIPLNRLGHTGTINVYVNGVVASDMRKFASDLRRELLRVKGRNGGLGLA